LRLASFTAAVMATAAVAGGASSASASTTPTYTCHGFTHGGYTAYDLHSKGVDCGTFMGFAKRIIAHGTGFLVAAKWTCHEAETAHGHGFVECSREPYLSLRFHFHAA
jgi:hypothetical protein